MRGDFGPPVFLGRRLAIGRRTSLRQSEHRGAGRMRNRIYLMPAIRRPFEQNFKLTRALALSSALGPRNEEPSYSELVAAAKTTIRA